MRETFTSGSVGRAPGNRCLYPEGDGSQRPLVPRSRYFQRLTRSAQHYTHLGDRAQGCCPAATMLCHGHGKERAEERRERGSASGVPEARGPAYEAPRPAVSPAECTAGQPSSHGMAGLGRNGGRVSLLG